MTCILSFVFGELIWVSKEDAFIKYWDAFEIYFTETFQPV